MKRSGPIRRSTPLRRTGPPQRVTPLSARPSRKAKANDAALAFARAEVLKRAGGRCEAQWPGCQIAAHHAHHRLRRSQGGAHTPENLLACCWHCHEQIHGNPERAYELGHLLRSTD